MSQPQLVLTIEIGIGALPLKFGMFPLEVHHILDREPDTVQKSYLKGFTEEFFNYPFLKLTFADGAGLSGIETTPREGVTVVMDGKVMLDDSGYHPNLPQYLSQLGHESVVKYGTVNFPQLGIAIPEDLEDEDGSFALEI